MTLIAALQLLLAATFFVIPFVAHRFGTAAQRAAEAEVARQGFPISVLADHRIRFEESAREMLFPLSIAVILTAVAALNLAGSGIATTLTWIVTPILLIGGGFVTTGQLFAARYVEAAVKRSADPRVRTADARAVIAAAQAEFPWSLRPLVVARFALTTFGSVLVIIVLAA